MKILKTSAILILFGSVFCNDDNLAESGLYFQSIYDTVTHSPSKSTSLLIPKEGMIDFENTLSIEFDIFFWRKDPFGFIISGGNKTTPDLFILSYSEYKNADTSYIELTYKNRPSVISIPIIDKFQGWKKWKNIALYLENDKQRIGLSYDNKLIKWFYHNSPLLNKLQIRFGATSRTNESPRMAIKNVTINKDEDHTKLWKLNQAQGTIAYENKNNGKNWNGDVVNGIWIKELHSTWYNTGSITLPSIDYKLIGFDYSDNNYVYATNDSLYFYDIVYNKVTSKKQFSFVDNDDYVYFYDETKKKIHSMHGGGGSPIGYYDFYLNKWIGYDNKFKSDDLYYQSTILINHKKDEIYSLGGYGWYEQKNILQKYNSITSRWDPVNYEVTGSHDFFPRSKSLVSYDKSNGRYILLGGGGNESGKQQQGFRKLNDLWSIDLEALKIEQIWADELFDDIGDSKNNEYIISPKHKTIYNLSRNDDLDQLSFTILQSSFDKKQFDKTNIKLSANVNSKLVDCFIVEKTDQLIAVLEESKSEKKVLSLYEINLPLLDPVQEDIQKAEYIWLALISSMILIVFISKPKKIKTINEKNNFLSVNPNIQNKNKILDVGLTIFLLGGFELWVNGRKISNNEWKSVKARNLFIYILLQNIKGASLNKIDSLFWPDVRNDSARNSRSVALNRIRKVIKPYSHMLKKVDDHIVFKMDTMTFFDYSHVLQLMGKSNNKDTSNLLMPLKMYGKSGLLPELKGDWIEYYRIDLSKSLEKYAKYISQYYIEEENWVDLEWIGNRLMLLNPFNDVGLYYSILANKKMNRNGISHQVYKEFVNNYEEKLGENYPNSYDNIISS